VRRNAPRKAVSDRVWKRLFYAPERHQDGADERTELTFRPDRA
jgi:hypothetical protein